MAQLFQLVVHDRFNMNDDVFHVKLRTAVQDAFDTELRINNQYFNLLFFLHVFRLDKDAQSILSPLMEHIQYDPSHQMVLSYVKKPKNQSIMDRGVFMRDDLFICVWNEYILKNHAIYNNMCTKFFPMNHIGTYTQDKKDMIPHLITLELRSCIPDKDPLFWIQTCNYIRDMLKKYDAQSNKELIEVEYCHTSYSPDVQIFIHM